MIHLTNRLVFLIILFIIVATSNAQVMDLKKTTEENDIKERDFFQKLLRPQYDGDVREVLLL
jgi:hypothetical protein